MEKSMSFLEHIGELRMHIIRSLIAIGIGAIIAFIFSDEIVAFIRGPFSSDFYTYQWFNQMGNYFGVGDIFAPFDMNDLVRSRKPEEQFTAYVAVLFFSGFILSFPYLIWEMWRFIAPGLTIKERKGALATIFFISFFFFSGIVFGYFILYPLAFHFFATFTPLKVEVLWDLSSFFSLFLRSLLAMGFVFLLPVFSYFLTRIGIITPSFMKTYRKHAIVIIMIISAFITPADIFSFVIVTVPLWLLYEGSILISIIVERRMNNA